MVPVLLLAAPVLHAPVDPGTKGLLVTVALILIGGLVAAHLRLLRAVSRARATLTVHPGVPASSPEPGRRGTVAGAPAVDEPVGVERR